MIRRRVAAVMSWGKSTGTTTLGATHYLNRLPLAHDDSATGKKIGDDPIALLPNDGNPDGATRTGLWVNHTEPIRPVGSV